MQRIALILLLSLTGCAVDKASIRLDIPAKGKPSIVVTIEGVQ